MLLVFFKGGTDRSGIDRHLETFSRIIHINGQWVVLGEWWRGIAFVRLKNSEQFYEIIIPVHLKDILVLFNSPLRVVLVTNWLPGAETASNL